MAHAHRHNRSIEFPIRLYETRKAYTFAIAQEILGNVASGGSASVQYTQVIELQVVGEIPFFVFFRRSGIGRSRNNIIAPRTVSCSTVKRILAVFGYQPVII